MKTTPKSLRLQIGLFGRTNVGKSSFLNMIAGQDVAIVSAVPGTTTDVVEKSMELLPLGPVVFLDTAGIDDESQLAKQRLGKTFKIFDRADVALLLVEPNVWGDYEEKVCQESSKKNIPIIIVINKIDKNEPDENFLKTIESSGKTYIQVSCLKQEEKDKYINEFKRVLMRLAPDPFLGRAALAADLVPAGGLAVLIVPIDLEAPKGRLILPQVQTIRDLLDGDAAAMVVKEREYAHYLEKLKKDPDLVICDSQVVMKMAADTPARVKCTTFSVLFSRYKGDLLEMVKGAKELDKLISKDRVLIAEACSHHAIEDDIGRVKIPRWLRNYTGADLNIDVCSGRDFPDDLKKYKLVISCGGCMLTRREMLLRIQKAQEQAVAITNYGVCIAKVQGVLKRILSPFPAALDVLENKKQEDGVVMSHGIGA